MHIQFKKQMWPSGIFFNWYDVLTNSGILYRVYEMQVSLKEGERES